ncbi:MAG: response regulator transcription factor [Anaerolineae bacterium]|nr:response regulator transcription factor [Anaerolineae bacterium]
MEQKIRVIITDDHEMVRRGLNTFLRVYPDLELVAEANSGEQALELCEKFSPDVVLMDLIMPSGMGGIEATRQIVQRFPKIKVIALSSAIDTPTVSKALEAGAMGYLMKNVSTDQLADAIRDVNQGKRALSEEATQALILAATQRSEPVYRLTEREYEVLHLLIEGRTNPEIAQKMTVSRSTVKYHISSILSKLGVTNRSEAVSLALRHRIIIES